MSSQVTILKGWDSAGTPELASLTVGSYPEAVLTLVLPSRAAYFPLALSSQLTVSSSC